MNLGALHLSVHAGTHADAPHHVRTGGDTTDKFDLSVFVGPVEVMSVEANMIMPRHVEDVGADRVLFRTDASTLSADEWPSTVTALHPDTVSILAESGVVLIGTDAPSVDPLDSTDLPAHQALIEAGIVNLEGLALGEVETGHYRLIALPMKVKGGDAAPVRAVLTSLQS